MATTSVYLGLGSNRGNRPAHLRAGLAALQETGLVLREVSSFYLTEPDLRGRDAGGAAADPAGAGTAAAGGTTPGTAKACTAAGGASPLQPRATGAPASGGDSHPWYLNCVAGFAEAPAAEKLLRLCLAIERRQGRARRAAETVGRAPEPRTLDLDILLVGDEVIDGPHLQVPHPRLGERRFVLEPLAEIAADHRHPVAGLTIGELLRGLPRREGVWLLAPPPEATA